MPVTENVPKTGTLKAPATPGITCCSTSKAAAPSSSVTATAATTSSQAWSSTGPTRPAGAHGGRRHRTRVCPELDGGLRVRPHFSSATAPVTLTGSGNFLAAPLGAVHVPSASARTPISAWSRELSLGRPAGRTTNIPLISFKNWRPALRRPCHLARVFGEQQVSNHHLFGSCGFSETQLAASVV